MPFDIEGWIEVARSPDTSDAHAWFGVVRLSSLVDVADEDTERLFGLSKLCVSGKKSVDALAADRGVPPNPSAQVRREMEEIAAHEAKYGSGEVGGCTFAVWSEIRAVELTDPPEESQWKLAFALARVLESVFGPERVRFVVWFRW
ncbi:MAG TPA: hypothetical protein VM529_19340 [Gemmata sp.]|nr:hypothetical protein [Gemmata sp.]